MAGDGVFRLDKKQRDRVADVFETHRRFIEAVAISQTQSRTDAADVVQEVAVRICRFLNGLRDVAALKCWLYQLTVNTARDMRDSRQSAERVANESAIEPGAIDVVDPDALVLSHERAVILRRAIRRLPYRERYTLRARFGMTRNRQPQTRDAIAAALGMSREGVRALEKRALADVARRLQRRRQNDTW